jgi:hypothetical protein
MTNEEIYQAVQKLKPVYLSLERYAEFDAYLRDNNIGNDIEAYKGNGEITVQIETP